MAKNKSKDNEESLGKSLLQVFLMFIGFMAFFLLLFKFVLANESVSGPSMQPTFENGDRIISVRHSNIQRGDIITLKAPDEPGAVYIKRVIGLPGDTVESKNDVLYVNGREVNQPFLTEYEKKLPEGQLYTNNFSLKQLLGVNKVPKDSYFVMGDHRNISKDSRIIGFIKKDAVVGEVKVRYFPFNQIRFF